jgi:hypothetical protein
MKTPLEIIAQAWVYVCIFVGAFALGFLLWRTILTHPRTPQNRCVYFVQPGEKLNIQVDDRGHCLKVLPR